MTLRSMTGFARIDGAHGDTAWHWELRSVNGRGLEIRLRLPSGFDNLETKVRGLAQEKLARGNCNFNLSLRREAGQLEIRLNEAAFAQAAAAATKAHALRGGKPVRLDTLLGMRGVVEAIEAEESEDAQSALAQVLIGGLEAALAELLKMREAEGARLSEVISAQLDQVASLVDQAANAASRRPDAIAARLKEQVGRLLEAGGALDAERLHQEAVLLATKADIEEELDRLRAHIAAARELLASSEPVGRRFEFLAQEFNREANTICSKASDIEISRAGLALKTVVDQLREQVQNIE